MPNPDITTELYEPSLTFAPAPFVGSSGLRSVLRPIEEAADVHWRSSLNIVAALASLCQLLSMVLGLVSTLAESYGFESDFLGWGTAVAGLAIFIAPLAVSLPGEIRGWCGCGGGGQRDDDKAGVPSKVEGSTTTNALATRTPGDADDGDTFETEDIGEPT